MSTIQFAHPAWLAAGILAGGGLAAAYRYFDKRGRADLGRFIAAGAIERLASSISRPRRWAKRGCFIAATVLLFAALARPQVGHEWREVKRRGIDILFALDASRSMLAEDVSPNRLGRAKLGMLDFIDKLEGDRVGLLPFAGSAFMLCPLTLDYDAFRESLDAVDTDIIPRKGTDLASAIREAGRAFDEAGNNHRILVIITDGEDLQGEALAAAKQAAADGMVIHTVGIGSPAGELIPLGKDFVRDQQGQPVRSKLDETSLRALAEATGGIYAPFGQAAEGLRQIYAEKLSLVPKGELAQRMQQVPIERYQWPLALAVALFILEFLLSDRRRQGARPSPTRAAAPAALALLLLAGADPAGAADARITYNDGVRSYQAGDLEGATQAFRSAIESTSDLPLQSRAYYNLGNAIFKSGAAKLGENADASSVIAEWERSLEAFDGALALDPHDADAQFNRDLVQKKIDDLKQQQQDKDQQKPEDQPQDNAQQKPEDQPQDGDRDQPEKQDSGADSKPQDEGGESGAQKPEPEEARQGAEPDDAPADQKENPETEGEATNQQQGEQPGKANNPEPSSAAEAGDTPHDAKADGQPQPGAGQPAEVGQIPDQQAAGAPADERRTPGEMSKEEARQLLQALEGDEKRVLLLPAQRGNPRDTNNTTNGKDW